MKGWLAFVTLALIAPAQEPPIVREGSYWVQTVIGSIPVSNSGRLHLTTQGNLTVRGVAGAGEIKYSLTKRVDTRSAQDAQGLLREFEVRSNSRGATVFINVLTPKRRLNSAELSVTVPTTLSQAILETLGGNVSASDMDGELRVETAGGRIELNRCGGNAVARTGGGEIRIGRVAGSMRCFSGAGNISLERCGRESWFETAGGDILIREAGASVHATTGGGNIKVDRSAGEVFARTAGGVIEVQHAAGLVTANTVAGAIQVNTAKGVRCESDAGAIRLRNIAGGSLRASTAIGNILAELLSGTRIEDSLLSTSAGDITVFISSNIPVTVQARNETAGGAQRIVSDFPEIRVRNIGIGGAVPAFADGALNGGGPVLRIFASGGTIFLRRQR